MTDLEQIAASVAKALGLEDWKTQDYVDPASGLCLSKSGANLFGPHWQVRCRDWLLHPIIHGKHALHIDKYWGGGRYQSGEEIIVALACPAAEFTARAIHELMKEGKS